MKRNTILVVDDCPIHQQVVKTMAERKGYHAEAMSDGVDVIIRTKSNTEHVCAILLDIFMPQVDGISALGQLRNKHPEIPVIIVSGTEDRDIIEAAESLGAQGFIQKPMTPEKFEHIVSLIESQRK